MKLTRVNLEMHTGANKIDTPERSQNSERHVRP